MFIPLLLMGGISQLFREFAITLSVAITVSMVISLTATPMMCAHLLKEVESHGWMYRISERAFGWVVEMYGKTLRSRCVFGWSRCWSYWLRLDLTFTSLFASQRVFSRSRTMDEFRGRF